jgi:succinate dehydrogenase / fumarate reductase cytochrome b subunit
VLAAGFLVHIAYSIWLTLLNRKARGHNSYAVNVRPKNVEWASQNMFVLGLIVVGFLLLHLSQFWYHMMFAELLGHEEVELCNGALYSTKGGAAFIKYYFGDPIITVLYLVWYAALWFHLTHGFWSALQTIGWSNTVWLNRWRVVSNIFATLILLGFAFVTLWFNIVGESIY